MIFSRRRGGGLALVALLVAAPAASAHIGTESSIQSVSPLIIGSGNSSIPVNVRYCIEQNGTETCLVNQTVTVPSSARLQLRFVNTADSAVTAAPAVCGPGQTGVKYVLAQSGTRHRGFEARVLSADGTFVHQTTGWVNRDSMVGNAESSFGFCVKNSDYGIPG